jgi:hypothetical protein
MDGVNWSKLTLHYLVTVMALRDWILDSGRAAASAIPAIGAIPDGTKERKLAEIATIALASSGNKETVESIDSVAAECIDVDTWLYPCCICGGIEFIGAIYTDIKPVESFWCVTCQEVPNGWIKRRRVNSQKRSRRPDRKEEFISLCEEDFDPSSANTPRTSSAEALKCFRIGYTWLNDHLDELLVAGWTRAELFRRGRYRWPIGDWGVAWLSSWSDPGKDASIGARGEIVFSFKTATGQAQQTAWPNVTNPLFKETR